MHFSLEYINYVVEVTKSTLSIRKLQTEKLQSDTKAKRLSGIRLLAKGQRGQV